MLIFSFSQLQQFEAFDQFLKFWLNVLCCGIIEKTCMYAKEKLVLTFLWPPLSFFLFWKINRKFIIAWEEEEEATKKEKYSCMYLLYTFWH